MFKRVDNSGNPLTRDQIAAALLAKLQSVGSTFITIGRKHVIPSPEQQPALFVVGTQDALSQVRSMPGRLQMTFHLFIYIYDDAGEEPLGQESSLVESKINDALDAIENALAPDEATGFQDLGGLVSHCWIEGGIDKDPGVFGKQGFAIVPVHVLAP
jgi:hypothetical protein